MDFESYKGDFDGDFGSIRALARNMFEDDYHVTVLIEGKSRRKMPKLQTGTAKIWVKKQDDKCGCPKLRPKQSYLILGNQRRIGRSKIIAARGRTGRYVYAGNTL